MNHFLVFFSLLFLIGCSAVPMPNNTIELHRLRNKPRLVIAPEEFASKIVRVCQLASACQFISSFHSISNITAETGLPGYLITECFVRLNPAAYQKEEIPEEKKVQALLLMATGIKIPAISILLTIPVQKLEIIAMFDTNRAVLETIDKYKENYESYTQKLDKNRVRMMCEMISKFCPKKIALRLGIPQSLIMEAKNRIEGIQTFTDLQKLAMVSLHSSNFTFEEIGDFIGVSAISVRNFIHVEEYDQVIKQFMDRHSAKRRKKESSPGDRSNQMEGDWLSFLDTFT